MLNVYVCLNSQHSRWRLKAIFNSSEFELEDNISIFYGNYFNSQKPVELSHFDHIKLADFFAHTAPELVVLRVSSYSAKFQPKIITHSVDLIWKNVQSQSED